MHASLETVLKSNVYMCFYVKRHLDYKPFSLPTYKIARENEAVKEREKEKEKERRERDGGGEGHVNGYGYGYGYPSGYGFLDREALAGVGSGTDGSFVKG